MVVFRLEADLRKLLLAARIDFALLLPLLVLAVCLYSPKPTTLDFHYGLCRYLPAHAAAGALLEILDLRHFSSVDLRPLLDDETQIWSRLLSWDYSGSAEMILRYVDAKILPGYAAVDRGRVFGYSFFVYEGSKGVIGDLYVTNGSGCPMRARSKSEVADPCHRDSAAVSGNPSRRGAIAGARGQCGFAPVSGNGIPAPSAAVYGAAAASNEPAREAYVTSRD